MISNRTTGNEYENLACEYLTSNGYKIINRNFYSKYGELDIVAIDGKYLCFIEVKYRKSIKAGWAQEAVSFSKIRKICRASDYYRLKNNISESTSIRFDVIAINGSEITIIKNAFEYFR